MLVLIGGLLLGSFLYFITVMKKDDAADVSSSSASSSSGLGSSKDNSETTPGEINMECSESAPKFICSVCGSRPTTMTLKIEERVEESTTIIEEEEEEHQQQENIVESSYQSFMRFNDNYSRRVPFPEAGVDIVDRKLKNTDESFEKEVHEYYCSAGDDILTYTESWTENWLFRKRDTATTNNNNNNNDNNETCSFKAVTMFVPNTSANYRAMIGDRNIDEMSDDDLSDCCCYCSDDSDDDGLDTTTTTTRRRKVENGMAKYIYDQRSKILLDGVSSKQHHRYDYSVEPNGEKLPSNGYSKSTALADDDDESICFAAMENASTREGTSFDYSTAATAAALNGVTNESSPSINGAEGNRSYRAEVFIETRDVNQNSLLADDDKLSDVDFNLFSPPKPGTIADREHRKWQTAAPMENNPYSVANLQRRLVEKKYCPGKYSSATSLLGMARIIDGLDDGRAVDIGTTRVVDFEAMDCRSTPDKSIGSVETPIGEGSDEIVNGKLIVVDFESTIIVPAEKPNDTTHGIAGNKSAGEKPIVNCAMSRATKEGDTKNKSRKSERAGNSSADEEEAMIEVTKKNATINEVDCSGSASSCDNSLHEDEKISLPSVKKLVEVFSRKQQRAIQEILKPEDKNTSDAEERPIVRPKFNNQRFARTQQPRPLHLHSLTARSLSKEFREGLR